MKKALAWLLLGSLPSFGWDVGFDFRATQSFVTDPAYAIFAAMGVTTYPTTATINGQAVTFGWESTGQSIGIRDRNASIDPRLAGMNCQQNDGNTSVFRIDLPSTGTYSIGLAAGDSAGFTQNNYISIASATSTVLSVQAITGATSTPNVADAAGTLWGLPAWPGSNVMVQKTFGTTILRMTLGGTVGATFSCVAHLRVTSVQASAPGVAGWSFFIL